MCDTTSAGRVFFVGAGPGAGDLITMRAARRIAEADVVVWPSGTVATDMVREHARPGAELVDSARLGDEQLVRLYRQAAAQRSTLVRLVPGDAAVWTGLQSHLDLCRRLGLNPEIVPGVSPMAAAVAATGRELVDPAVLLTQFDPTAPAPAGTVSALGVQGAVVVSTSASRTEALVARLRAAGHPDAAPVTVMAKAGRPDEVLFSTTLGELDEAVKRHRLWVPALFLVGRAPAPSDGSIQYSSPRSTPSTAFAASASASASVSVSASVDGTGPASRRVASDGRVPAGGVPASGVSAAAPALHRPYRRRRRSSQGGSA